MIEVFKTNVTDKEVAYAIVDLIHRTFDGYHANFDLDDCDRVLRVQGITSPIEANMIIALLADYGHFAEVLDDMLLESTE